MAWKIKTGDEVFVISGDSKGIKGKILRVDRKTSRVLVSGVNVRSRHVKPSPQNPEGGVIRKECPIHVSNVALAVPRSSEHDASLVPTRVGFRFSDSGKKVRYAKRNQIEIQESRPS
jgi:large subunit ribosomal protein L24